MKKNKYPDIAEGYPGAFKDCPSGEADNSGDSIGEVFRSWWFAEMTLGCGVLCIISVLIGVFSLFAGPLGILFAVWSFFWASIWRGCGIAAYRKRELTERMLAEASRSQ